MKTKRVTIRLEEDKYRILERLAKDMNIKITMLIKHLAYRYIREVKKA